MISLKNVMLSACLLAILTLPVQATYIVAHRGNSSQAPENTIAAIQHAADVADYTEFDIRETSDGHLVLMHDTTVDRTTNGAGPIAGMTLADVKTLDAGSWFDPAFAGERVPTMAEAIEAALDNGLTPLIEHKTGAAEDYYDVFTDIGVIDKVVVISFEWNFLDDLDHINSGLKLGALGSGPLNQSTINNAVSKGADFLVWIHDFVGQVEVDLVHDEGLELLVGTVDDKSRWSELIDIGVDGISTNRPTDLHAMLAPEPSAAVTLWVACCCIIMMMGRRWMKASRGKQGQEG